MLEVDWPFFGEICRALALRVAKEYQPEIVLGIAKAGVIPGVVVASIMQCDFASMVVTRQKAGAQPVLVSGPPASIRGRRVLVVDETCDTGSTMKLALSEVRALQPAEVRSAVSFKTGDYAPGLPRLRDRQLHHPALGPGDHPGRGAGRPAGLRRPGCEGRAYGGRAVGR